MGTARHITGQQDLQTEALATIATINPKTKKEVDVVAEGYLRHLNFCVEVGLVDRASTVLKFVSQYDLSNARELSNIYKRAETWLPNARQQLRHTARPNPEAAFNKALRSWRR